MAREVDPEGASGPAVTAGRTATEPPVEPPPTGDPGGPASSGRAGAPTRADADGVADEDLRPALELGFAVALVFSRQRPAQPVPAALRPYLRFQKLPTAALGPLRRVLATDVGFRERTATVADEAIIGRASWLWLVRPDGWQDELGGLPAHDRAADHGGSEDEEHEGRDGATADPSDPSIDGPVRRPVKRPPGRAGSDGVITDRKLAKRLEAAELALVRTRVDADELRAELQALRSRRDDDATAVPKLTAKVAQLETELRGARRRLDEQRQSAVETSARAAQAAHELTEARGALARAEAERAEAAADAAEHRARFTRLVGRVADLEIAAPAGPQARGAAAPVDERGSAPSALSAPAASTAPRAAGDDHGAGALPLEAREVLREVAGATRRLGDVLDQLAGALDGRGAAADRANTGSPGRPDDDRDLQPAPGPGGPVDRREPAGPKRSAPTRRRPLPTPGGVLADSVPATEHLLRQPALVLVDGYNVAKLGWPGVDLAGQRTRLLGMLDEVGARFGTDLRVVFDGSEVSGPAATTGARRRVPVTFSPAGVPADDVLVELVRAQPPDRHVVLVTNDQELRSRVRELGGNLVRSDQLLAVARR